MLFRMFDRFVLVWICRFPLPLGVWEGLRFVIVALSGLFSYHFSFFFFFFFFFLHARDTSVFSIPNDNLSKYEWVFMKLAICIDIVKIGFGDANRQILSIFYSYLPATHPYFRFMTIT